MPTASVDFNSDERGVSEVIGTILLVSLTVGLTAGFAAFLTQALPGPDVGLAVRLEGFIEPGDCPWGSGDEQVRLRHGGGEHLSAAATAVRLAWQDELRVYGAEKDADPLGGDFDDGRLTIGENWTSAPLRVDAGTLVILDVVSSDDRGSVVQTSYLRADAARCGAAVDGVPQEAGA